MEKIKFESFKNVETFLNQYTGLDKDGPTREGMLRTALEEYELPEYFLLNFACDCAGRALQNERKAGRTPAPQFANLIKVARAVVRGLIPRQDLTEMAEATIPPPAVPFEDSQAYHFIRDTFAWMANPAKAAAGTAAFFTAQKAEYHATFCCPCGESEVSAEAELDWQFSHLLKLVGKRPQTVICTEPGCASEAKETCASCGMDYCSLHFGATMLCHHCE